MRLTVLCDNHTFIDRYYLGEPASCYYIEDGDSHILFDAGYSGVFLENAARMGIDLGRVTDIALSHGHNDHTGGLPAFLSRFSQPVRLYAHPDLFLPKRHEGLDVGCPLPLSALPAQVEPHLSREPQRVSPHVRWLGEIPRRRPFESDRAVGEACRDGVWAPDAVPDDTSLLLDTPEGGLLLTGCAHAGVCNTLDAATALSGAPVRTVMGGMHLFETGPALADTIAALSEAGVTTLLPCHCTSLAVKSAFFSAFDVQEVGVGLTFSFTRKRK